MKFSCCWRCCYYHCYRKFLQEFRFFLLLNFRFPPIFSVVWKEKRHLHQTHHNRKIVNPKTHRSRRFVPHNNTNRYTSAPICFIFIHTFLVSGSMSLNTAEKINVMWIGIFIRFKRWKKKIQILLQIIPKINIFNSMCSLLYIRFGARTF